MLSVNAHYNVRDIIDIKPLPTPSCIGEKVSVRSSTTYISPSLKKDQWKNNHERRTKQVTECGYRSVPHRPYKPVGEMCLDEKQLILSALGQSNNHADQDGGTNTPSDKGLYHDIARGDKSKVTISSYKKLLKVQDLVNKDSDRISKIKLGHGLFQIIKDEEKAKAQKAVTEEIEAKARANKQWKPSKGEPDSSSDDDDDIGFREVVQNYLIRYQTPSLQKDNLELPSTTSSPIGVKFTPVSARQTNNGEYSRISLDGSPYGDTKEHSGRSTESPHPNFRLHRKHYRSRKSSSIQVRPFSPYYSSVASSPIQSDREHIFRQLCVIQWLLEATALELGYIMVPISACWKLNESNDGKMSRKRQEKDNKKALDNKWDALCNNPHQLSNIIKMPDKPKTARGQKILKEGWLVKRSRNRNAINKDANYRSRYVRLTKDYLIYYLNEKLNNYKDCIHLKYATIVESVKDHTFEKKKNVFQIGQKNDFLYLLAQSDSHREDWLNAIRNACMRLRNKMDKKFHPGALTKGERWSCCSHLSSAEGCEDAFDYTLDTKVIKEGWLTKRSRNRKDPKKEANYRDRYVRMTTECLSYYITNKANAVPKDSMKLKDVTIVEAVTDGTFGERKYFFQVGSKGDLLYAHAMNPTDRDEWVLALRQCCQRLKLNMDRRYHPGAYTDKWSCCQAVDLSQNGCQHAFDYSTELSTVVKKGWVVKRSRGRGKSKNAANYRERFVVLTEEFLSYYGNEAGEYKDCINMKHVSIVEPVNDGTLERDFVFQVGSKGDILYICAPNEEEREDWIVALRFVTQQLHNKMEDRFHPGGFTRSKWTCCDYPSLDEDGCQRAFDYSKGVAYSPKTEEDYYPMPTDDSLYAFNGNISPFMVGSSTTPKAETAINIKSSRRASLAKSSDINQITRRVSMAMPPTMEGIVTGRRSSMAVQAEAIPLSSNKRHSTAASKPTDFSQITRRISLAVGKIPTQVPLTPGGQNENAPKSKWPIAALRSIQKFMQYTQHRRIRTLGNAEDVSKDKISDDAKIRAWIEEFGGIEEDDRQRKKKLRPQSAPVKNTPGTAGIERYQDLASRMRQKFIDVAKENEELLHDQLDRIEMKRSQKCELRFFAIEPKTYVHRDLGKMRHKIKKIEIRQANKSVHRPWYINLVDTLPESIREDRQCSQTLERISSHAKIDGIVPSSVQLIRVLSGLRHWEICSPDISAAIEFVREKIVEMPDYEYEEWLRSILPMKKPRAESDPTSTNKSDS
ncbi:uncharacterized protein TRIADDRAFT_61094 [Trichoplax adhaerens]|uniref:PH domain-containing protein n=1 Tax=Trichoplax adhaerens TaxID=10228 RepID=B3SA09_TRIAD|nr:hypothetical protein TRIADDRAFT_61094 [Trichoplax adhaerens]EDV20359.1 hypothetical protein TRIADDRAFT_61094 [Trichoplax adhaerens]|eukprot:XP_002117053.1 hypothetical protein TRIADDRAFT_61094 [Trichoplax adhaerens]